MPTGLLPSFPAGLNLLLFAAAGAAVWISGTRLAHYADEIAERKGISSAFMGLVFLAAATELPELATTITAAIKGNAPLVLNNMFGGITMQTAILAVADATAVGATLTGFPRGTAPVLQGALLVLLLSLLLAITALGDAPIFGLNVGVGVLVLAAAYGLAIKLVHDHERNSSWQLIDIPSEYGPILAAPSRHRLGRIRIQVLYALFLGAASVVLVAGYMLILLSEALAVQTGLGASFIGVTLLAAATSLPELSTTLSAVRIGAYSMAIANIFGSNLIMLALLLPADIFYTGDLLLNGVGGSARFALITGTIVTAVYVIGLLTRNPRRIFGMGVDSALVLCLYAASVIAYYHLR